jgi:DNA-binding transcriptional regulator YhcF (GntR family)
MEEIFDENQPIYLQIVQRISAQILRGEFKPGDKLPAVIDAAMQFKVNHNTIHHAYQELIRQGVAVTRRGEGTFVTTEQTILNQCITRCARPSWKTLSLKCATWFFERRYPRNTPNLSAIREP